MKNLMYENTMQSVHTVGNIIVGHRTSQQQLGTLQIGTKQGIGPLVLLDLEHGPDVDELPERQQTKDLTEARITRKFRGYLRRE